MLLVKCDCVVLIVVTAYYLKDWNDTAGRDLEDFRKGASPFDHRRRYTCLPYGAFQERFRKTLVRGANQLATHCEFGGWNSRLKLDLSLDIV